MALQKEFEKQGNFLFRYRSLLPLIILVVGIGVFIHTLIQAKSTGQLIYADKYEFICLGVSLIGLWIRMYSVGHTPSNTSGRNRKKQIADELNSTGIYSTVRHPLYLGNFFMWLGVAMLSQNFWFTVAFIILYCFYYERIMYAEEQFLSRKFGEKYSTWADRTPAIIPSFSNWEKPKYSFDLKKVLRKEKNGILAIFMLFLVFDVIKEFVLTQQYQYKDSFWFYAAIASIVYYLLIKLFKKATRLFS